MITFVYDKKLNKVGCALLQAAYGSTIDNYNLAMFGTENWVLAPTPDLTMYHAKDQAQLDSIIEYTKLANAKE